GRNLREVLKSPKARSPHSVLYFQWQEKWAVREGNWKLIRMKESGENAAETITLHNLADDKPEAKDHAAGKPQIVNRLRKRYDAWRQDVSK
ncbi:MAG: hypothetical protein N2C14_08270, partial [Planctomycetales bacterium]